MVSFIVEIDRREVLPVRSKGKDFTEQSEAYRSTTSGTKMEVAAIAMA